MKSNLMKYLMGSKNMRLNSLENLRVLLQDKDNLEFFIRNADNFAFRSLVDDLSLSEEIVDKREALETDVVNNYEKHSLKSVQEAISDLLFHNNSNNVILTIQTLKERADNIEEFNSYYDEYREFFDKVTAFLNLKEGDVNQEQLGLLIQDLSSYKSKLSNKKQVFDVVQDLYKKAETDFTSELSTKIKSSGERIFEGIAPEEIELPDGRKVQYYKMQNQTENQRKFNILARSSSVFDYMTEDGARDRYQEEVSKYDYFSYSIFNESLHNSFVRKRIRFGFFDLGQGELLSSNTYDGQTNQYTVVKGKHNFEQQLLPIDEFTSQTNSNSYNEVVFNNPETIIPSVIITSSEIPTEEELKVASAFNIPLIFIDDRCYEKTSSEGRERRYFTYNEFLKESLGKTSSESEKGN